MAHGSIGYRKYAFVVLVLFAALVVAQNGIGQWVYGQWEMQRRGRGFRGATDRSAYLTWEVDPAYKDDVFTFVRIQYDSDRNFRRGRSWRNDYPDCDWNFSIRLHELTSMQVDPNGKVIRLTDPSLFDYPFIYMSNVGRMSLDDREVKALRRYLLNGGFLMADDFWAPPAWRHVRGQMQRVFPDRQPRELGSDHEIFNIVYQLQGTPQVPSIFAWQQGDSRRRTG